MSPFTGFSTPQAKNTPLPDAFFSELLPQIEDLFELKLTLKAFQLLNFQEGDLRYLTLEDFSKEDSFYASFDKSNDKIQSAIESAVRRGTLLPADSDGERIYFLNTPRGRAALEGLSKGVWRHRDGKRAQAEVSVVRPNIYLLYEQNIGPLTPILAQTLEEAEKLYPEDWIRDAVKIAVTKNVRNWRFIEAILRSWQEKGRDETDQRSTKENRRRDSEGEYGDYIIH